MGCGATASAGQKDPSASNDRSSKRRRKVDIVDDGSVLNATSHKASKKKVASTPWDRAAILFAEANAEEVHRTDFPANSSCEPPLSIDPTCASTAPTCAPPGPNDVARATSAADLLNDTEIEPSPPAMNTGNAG